MFRCTDTFTVQTEDGGQLIIQEHSYYQGDELAPGMKQYRTKDGTSVKRISASEFEIAGRKGAMRARIIAVS